MTLPFLKTLIFFILHGYVCIPFDFLEYCTKIFFIMMTGFPGAPLNFVLKESISLAYPHPSPGCQEVTCMFSFFLGGDLVSLYENSYFYTCNTCAAHTVLLLHWGWSCEWGRASHRSCCQLLDSPVITITTTCWDYMLGLHARTTCHAWGQWFNLSGGDQYVHFTDEETGLRAIKLVQAHKRLRG